MCALSRSPAWAVATIIVADLQVAESRKGLTRFPCAPPIESSKERAGTFGLSVPRGGGGDGAVGAHRNATKARAVWPGLWCCYPSDWRAIRRKIWEDRYRGARSGGQPVAGSVVHFLP